MKNAFNKLKNFRYYDEGRSKQLIWNRTEIDDNLKNTNFVNYGNDGSNIFNLLTNMKLAHYININ